MFLPGHRSLVAHAECAGIPRVMREAQMKTPNREQLGAEFWWLGAESNHRHADFQSAALPTELPSQQVVHCSKDFALFAQEHIFLQKTACCSRADAALPSGPIPTPYIASRSAAPLTCRMACARSSRGSTPARRSTLPHQPKPYGTAAF